MAKVQAEGDRLTFRCPGCEDTHEVRVGPGAPWTWNGSLDAPTFAPSVLVRSGHYASGRGSEVCWCTYNAEHPDSPAPFHCYLCHSFVRDGMIEFLGDCTHALAGQTVPLPDWAEAAMG